MLSFSNFDFIVLRCHFWVSCLVGNFLLTGNICLENNGPHCEALQRAKVWLEEPDSLFLFPALCSGSNIQRWFSANLNKMGLIVKSFGRINSDFGSSIVFKLKQPKNDLGVDMSRKKAPSCILKGSLVWEGTKLWTVDHPPIRHGPLVDLREWRWSWITLLLY